MNNQISVDEIIQTNYIKAQPYRMAGIDECGNFGFDFSKPDVSTHYIICAVIVDNNKLQNINQQIEEIRKSNFGGGEIKSSAVGKNIRRRAKIITELLQIDFSLIFLIADKRKFDESGAMSTYKKSFVKFLHEKLYDSMYHVYPKLKIIEDEQGYDEFQVGYKKYINLHRPVFNLFNDYDFDYAVSDDNNIIQIADFLAGSLMHHINDKKAPDVLKIFRGQIRDIINYPFIYNKIDSEKNASKNDSTIYSLANKCATDYIEKNKKSGDEALRLNVQFLRILLYTAYNYSNTKFLYAKEIVDALSDIFDKKITSNYLYRKITPSLRDAGVIISSCNNGYKLPSCMDDIYKYINQTNGVVSPMLHRIGICRKLILQESDGSFDILDEYKLENYKRYFGDY